MAKKKRVGNFSYDLQYTALLAKGLFQHTDMYVFMAFFEKNQGHFLVRNYHYYNPSSFILFLFLLQILQKLRLSKIGTKEMVRTWKSSSFAWFMPNQKER